jgi:hypothetical protein
MATCPVVPLLLHCAGMRTVETNRPYLVPAILVCVLLVTTAVVTGYSPHTKGGVATVPVPVMTAADTRVSQTPISEAPPPGSIVLKIIDSAQAPIAVPVHGKLLIVACDRSSPPPLASCLLGLLDPTSTQLVRIRTTNGLYPPCSGGGYASLDWSPDGMRFLCSEVWGGFSVQGLDGKEQFASQYYSASWSPDGRYLSALTCEGPHLQRAYTFTIYAASSWQPVCAVSYGDLMACDSGNARCELPLNDGRIWLLERIEQPSGLLMNQLRSAICDTVQDCPPDISPTPVPTLQARYQAKVTDEHWLMITDTQTGQTQLLAIPGYRFESVTWSPP